MNKDYDVLNELVPETQKLHRAIFDKGYNQGFDKGFEKGFDEKISNINDLVKEQYNKGLEDAWDVARKLYNDQGFSTKDLSDTFGTYYPAKVIKFYSIQEAKEKIDAWEKKKEELNNEIHIGDEIYVDAWGLYLIVTKIGKDEKIEGICSDGACYSVIPKKGIKKTDRHFTSDLSNLLSMIGEDENDRRRSIKNVE